MIDCNDKEQRKSVFGKLIETIGHALDNKVTHITLPIYRFEQIEAVMERQEEIIEDQEERIAIMSEGGWIPVNKRLPKKSGYYIVAKYTNYIGNHGEYKKYESSQMWFDSEKQVFTEHATIFDPTHWMNMPKPPKGAET